MFFKHFQLLLLTVSVSVLVSCASTSAPSLLGNRAQHSEPIPAHLAAEAQKHRAEGKAYFIWRDTDAPIRLGPKSESPLTEIEIHFSAANVALSPPFKEAAAIRCRLEGGDKMAEYVVTLRGQGPANSSAAIPLVGREGLSAVVVFPRKSRTAATFVAAHPSDGEIAGQGKAALYFLPEESRSPFREKAISNILEVELEVTKP